MDPQLLSGLLGFVGGIVSSAIATFTVLYARRLTDKALESDEIRKRRVEIIYNLLGSRYVLTDKYQAASCEVQVFNTAMAAFSVYFTNDRAVAEAYDRFLNSKTDDNLTAMLSIAAKIAKLDLLDTQLKRVLTIPASNFSVTINPSAVPTLLNSSKP